MTTTQRPEKRLIRCEHPATEMCGCRQAAAALVLARWTGEDAPAPENMPADIPTGRQVVVLSGIRQPRTRSDPQPLEIADDDARYGDSPLGALGAWACVALSVLLMLALAGRGLWLWIG